jgi:hypothetical protein
MVKIHVTVSLSTHIDHEILFHIVITTIQKFIHQTT